MGRSEKKIKSDRVNALRKKYDAYLEEDKKRKERNEYILEKLDKMRCCTALVQVRHKPSVIEDHRQAALYNLSNPILEDLVYQPIPSSKQIYFPQEIPAKLVDESTLLQEISKKYILIPKIRPEYNKNFMSDVKPEKDENNDWKSKYDILEQLKKDEKEEPVSIPKAAYVLKNNAVKHDNISKTASSEDFGPPISISEQPQSYQDNYYSNENEPVQEVINNIKVGKQVNTNEHNNEDNIMYQYENSDEVTNNEMTPHNIKETSNKDIVYKYDNFDEVLNNEVSQQENNTDNLPNENVNTSNSLGYIEPDAQDYYTEVDNQNNDIKHEYTPGELYNAQQQHFNEETNNVPMENESHYPSNTEDENVIPTIHSSEFVEEINRDMTNENQEDITEQYEHPTEVINIQDFTPHNDVQLQDGVNINPDQQVMQASGDGSYNNIETISISNNEQEKLDSSFDPVVVTDDTDLADTPLVETYPENTEHYYDEQTNANYTYDENNVVENYNAEYPAQEQNYTQEEYAAYYEGAQIEQPYTIEANENDATLQRYDQNYEQQYGADYNQQEYQQGYEEQQYAEQGYEQNEYSGQPELDHSQQENVQYNIQGETPQYVEQVLDNEEGYVVEKQNEAGEISGIEKSLNQQPSPTPTEEQQVNKA